MEKAAPKLSIITPFRNASPWIRECITSVLQQSFTDWEWILVDDHSTDDSRQVVSAFAGKDPRFQIHTNSGNGILPALQKAFSHATGDYITRMDADDLMPAGRLQKMVGALEKAPPKRIVTGLVKYFSEEEVTEGYRQYESWLNETALQNRFSQNIYRECVIASPNWMMRRSELAAAGGFDNLLYPEDYDLVFRWYANNFKIETIPEVTLYWREYPDRTSRNSSLYGQKSFFNLKVKRFTELDLRSSNLCLWGMGRKAKFTARVLDELEIPFHWMVAKADPGKIYNHQTRHFHEVEKLEKPQVLVAVYPPERKRKQLREYLQRQQTIEGESYWFL